MTRCEFMDQNGIPLDGWSLDVRIEDSVSGKVQVAGICNALLTEILGKPIMLVALSSFVVRS